MADTYTIVSQQPTTAAVAGGTFQPVYEITFTTKPSNVTGVVRVPMSQYTADNVDRLIRDQAEIIESVHNL